MSGQRNYDTVPPLRLSNCCNKWTGSRLVEDFKRKITAFYCSACQGLFPEVSATNAVERCSIPRGKCHFEMSKFGHLITWQFGFFPTQCRRFVHCALTSSCPIWLLKHRYPGLKLLAEGTAQGRFDCLRIRQLAAGRKADEMNCKRVCLTCSSLPAKRMNDRWPLKGW